MARRSDHSREDLRAMVLDAATREIDARGVAALSMRKIAKQIGYTVGTLYLIFPNQDALLLTINLATADALKERLTRAVAEPTDHKRMRPGTQIGAQTRVREAIAMAYIDFARSYPHRWRLLFELDADLPEFSAPVQSRVAELFAMIDQLFAAPAQAASETRARATAFWAGVHGIATLVVTGRLGWSGSDVPEDALRSLLAAFNAA